MNYNGKSEIMSNGVGDIGELWAKQSAGVAEGASVRDDKQEGR